MTTAKPLVVPALKRHTATVIFAHGLGDSGAGWLPLAETWKRQKKLEEVSFIFPNAPDIPITINMGMPMPGWYDIRTIAKFQENEDEVGILRSRDYLHSLIDQEVAAGIPANRIVLGGFSQGGAISLITGTSYSHKLGGIFGLSSYLLMQKRFQELIPAENPNKETPIFMGHGDSDPVVQYDWGVMTAERLRDWGWNVDFRTYDGMLHSSCPEEIDDLVKYITTQIPPLEEKAATSKGQVAGENAKE